MSTHAGNGDQEAFAALFDQYKNLVYRTAYLVLGESEEAEDALQEVFVQLYRSLPHFDPAKAALSTWLYRLTVNHCLNRRRRKRIMTSLADGDELPAIRSEFPEGLLAEEEAIHQAIRALSEKQRVVVVLRYFQDLSYAEIGEILSLPIGTVKSRLNLALQTLRRSLEKPSVISTLGLKEVER